MRNRLEYDINTITKSESLQGDKDTTTHVSSTTCVIATVATIRNDVVNAGGSHVNNGQGRQNTKVSVNNHIRSRCMTQESAAPPWPTLHVTDGCLVGRRPQSNHEPNDKPTPGLVELITADVFEEEFTPSGGGGRPQGWRQRYRSQGWRRRQSQGRLAARAGATQTGARPLQRAVRR